MRWQRAVDQALRPLGLTHTKYLVLAATKAAIDETRDAVSQQAVAERAGLDRATTSDVMRSLDQHGLVARRSDGEDARQWRISVTSSGTSLLRTATPLVADVERKLHG